MFEFITQAATALIKLLTGAVAAAEAAMSDKPCKEPEQPCPLKKDRATIVKVEYLDGDDTKELSGQGTHYCNLPRDAKYVDGTHVKNIDRTTQRPRIKVKFDKPGSHSFKIKHLPPPGSNAVYTAPEKGRVANFKYEETQLSFSTDADGTKIIDGDMFIAAAGKDTYQVEAEDDNGVKVKSSKIETMRMIWYVELKMTGLPAAASVSTLESEFAKHSIKLLSLGTKNMTLMENISTGDSDTFKANAKTAYETSNGPTKAPYTIAIGYTGHLAVKNPDQSVSKSGVDVGPGKPAVVIPIVGPGLTNPAIAARSLWKDLVTGEGWFVSAKFVPADGTAAVVIPEAKCTAVAGSSASNCRSVSVDVTGLAAGNGSIELVVHWVDRMRGGLSFPGTNLICVCTRSWWTDKSAAAQNQVLIHELGHQVNMVADGTTVDKVSTHYDSSKGHVGDHCHNGSPVGQARYDAATDASASTCVMYGATNGKSDFCGNCAPAVRKQDLSPGWTAL